MKSCRLYLVRLGRRTITFPFLTPPLGIMSLAGYIRENMPDVEVGLYDQRAVNGSIDDIIRQASDFKADVIGFSVLSSFAHTLGPLTEGIRTALPDCAIVLGGPHASAFRAQSLVGNNADAAVVGEGEVALEEIIKARLDGGTLDSIPGLVWRDEGSAETIENPGEIPFIKDLDSLPFLAYDLLDMEPYWTNPPMAPLPPRKYVSFFTSRGCPYRCVYCHNVFGKRFRGQSAERMVEEVGHFTRKYDLREVEFLDDMFNQDPKRVLDFCEGAQQRDLGLKINLPNSLRTDILTEDVIDALADTGLYHSAFALETGSPRLQKMICKNLNIPKFLRNVELATRRNIFAHGFTMLGFPSETEEEIRTTIEVACSSRLHEATFFTVTPYPGTKLYEMAREAHPDKLERLSYDNQDYHSIETNFSAVPDDVFFSYQRWAWRKFYMSPKRLLRIARDYPQPSYLPYYLPAYLRRWMKGVF